MKILRTKRYSKDLKRIGATDAEVLALETAVASNPSMGDVIPGLGGIRKLRFSLGNKGKRGGGRAIYFMLIADDTAIMLFAYSKADREDLTNDEKKAAMTIMRELTNG